MVRVDGPDGPPWLLPTRAREGVVGLHDLLHELVPNDVFLVEVDEADPLDVLDDLQRFHEPRLPWMWQVDLCDVTSDDRLGTESETGQEHLHLLGRGVLCLVEALKIVKDVEGLGFIYFDEKDVVRHKLVQQIVKAYEGFSSSRGQT